MQEMHVTMEYTVMGLTDVTQASNVYQREVMSHVLGHVVRFATSSINNVSMSTQIVKADINGTTKAANASTGASGDGVSF